MFFAIVSRPFSTSQYALTLYDEKNNPSSSNNSFPLSVEKNKITTVGQVQDSIFNYVGEIIDDTSTTELDKQKAIEYILENQFKIFFTNQKDRKVLGVNLNNISPLLKSLIFEFKEDFNKYYQLNIDKNMKSKNLKENNIAKILTTLNDVSFGIVIY